MRIVLFGPPGVGKGSQASMLQERLGLHHISTGIILRNAIRAESGVGREARRYVESGKLVPGGIVRSLAEGAMEELDYDNFVLDGYPRTIEQADWLEEFLQQHEAPLGGVISLRVPDEVIVDRLSKRRVDRETGENYHLDFRPPPLDLPDGRIIQRQDDLPEAIRKRLRVYRDETEPVEEHYRKLDMLEQVDGVGSFDSVHKQIVELIRQFEEAV